MLHFKPDSSTNTTVNLHTFYSFQSKHVASWKLATNLELKCKLIKSWDSKFQIGKIAPILINSVISYDIKGYILFNMLSPFLYTQIRLGKCL